MISSAVLLQSAALGVGLAMDAFSVSLANGLKEPRMNAPRMGGISAVYSFFQFMMPLIGWICISNIARTFEAFEKFIPWIALILLLYIGIGMIRSGRRTGDGPDKAIKTEPGRITLPILLMQGVATSIDALSVGFAFAGYDWKTALVCAIIIGVVTFVICLGGLVIGKKAGVRLSGKAEIIGGIILVLIGIEIFVKGVFL